MKVLLVSMMLTAGIIVFRKRLPYMVPEPVGLTLTYKQRLKYFSMARNSSNLNLTTF